MRQLKAFHRFILLFPCFIGWHCWIARGEYRRICRDCPRIEIWAPEEGWFTE